MIRKCTLNDLDFCFEVAEKFGVLAGHVIDRDRLQETLLMLMDHGVMIRSDKGIIGGMIFPFYMSGEIACQEFFWYSEGGDGVDLLKEFERICKEEGVSRVIMSTLCNDYQEKIDSLLLNNGYRHFEHSLVRNL